MVVVAETGVWYINGNLNNDCPFGEDMSSSCYMNVVIIDPVSDINSFINTQIMDKIIVLYDCFAKILR